MNNSAKWKLFLQWWNEIKHDISDEEVVRMIDTKIAEITK